MPFGVPLEWFNLRGLRELRRQVNAKATETEDDLQAVDREIARREEAGEV